MKRLLIIAASAALLLTGCSGGGQSTAGTPSTLLKERTITLTDGRTITCIIYQNGYAGGLSCDWDNE